MKKNIEILLANKLAGALYDIEELSLKDQTTLLNKMIATANDLNEPDTFLVPVCIALMEECFYQFGLRKNPTTLPSHLREAAKKSVSASLQEFSNLVPETTD